MRASELSRTKILERTLKSRKAQRLMDELCDDNSLTLSADLSSAIFHRAVTKAEAERLRLRCENYQREDFKGWDPAVFFPYSQYFGYLSSLKARAVMEELAQFGYLGSSYRLVDIGAGTLGASLGIIDFCRERGIEIREHYAVDKDLKPLQWAKDHFSSYLSSTVISHNWPRPDRFNEPSTDQSSQTSLYVLSDVFAENSQYCSSFEQMRQSPFAQNLLKAIRGLSEKSILIFIEPAHKKANRNLLHFRDLLSKEISILLPCPHSQPCPAIPQNEWCHEEKHFRAPDQFSQLVHRLGFARRYLQYSQLCLGPQDSYFKSHHARVVSRQLKSKGRCDKWLCQNGQRWKASLLMRHKKSDNASYYDSERGTVLDTRELESISTPPSPTVKL